MATPHNKAERGDFAPVVIMPGDPRRSEFIAQNYLKDARLVNDVRGVKGYTGTYKGKPVSVMAHGMGMPSAGIYFHELYAFYGVSAIIRTGSSGAISDKTALRDIVVAESAYTDSNVLEHVGIEERVVYASSKLLELARLHAPSEGVVTGRVLTSDVFYDQKARLAEARDVHGCISVEMETAMLYAMAKKHGKDALALLTVSDNAFDEGGGLDADERERSFGKMLAFALDIAADV